MKIQLIRNATMKITYAGKTILTDPMFSKKDSLEPFAGIARNPTVELPFDPNEIINGIDAVLVSHTHPDHFDLASSEILPKNIPLFCQPVDEEKMQTEGFLNIHHIDQVTSWNGISFTRTGGNHGSGDILKHMGEVSGYILQADKEPTVYWIGDSIWCEEVERNIIKFNPDVIITHSGGAVIPGFISILMNDQETIAVANAAPEAKIVAIHLESLDHCTVSRQTLREFGDKLNISRNRLLIPKDGEIISFE